MKELICKDSRFAIYQTNFGFELWDNDFCISSMVGVDKLTALETFKEKIIELKGGEQ